MADSFLREVVFEPEAGLHFARHAAGQRKHFLRAEPELQFFLVVQAAIASDSFDFHDGVFKAVALIIDADNVRFHILISFPCCIVLAVAFCFNNNTINENRRKRNKNHPDIPRVFSGSGRSREAPGSKRKKNTGPAFFKRAGPVRSYLKLTRGL